MLAIRPPEYFPRLEYAALLVAAERFVLADTFQYSRQSFQNRTRLRNPEGWQWVSVPLKGGQHGRPIHAVRIRPVPGWQKQHWKAFHFNYRRAPFFEFYEEALRPFFERPWTHLGALTCATVECLHRLLGLSTPLMRASALPEAPATLPALVEAGGGAPLVTLPETAPHDAAEVADVRVLRFDHPEYYQVFNGFEPGMSAFDLLFNYGPEARGMLERATRLTETLR